MKVVEYDIIKGDTCDALVQQVNDHLITGWQPRGGVMVVDNHMTFFQAMVRYEAVPHA